MYPAILSPPCMADGPKLYPVKRSSTIRRMFCKEVPIIPNNNKAAHFLLGSGTSRDIRANTTRNTDIEAAPEHAALISTSSLSPCNVVIDITVSLISVSPNQNENIDS